MSFKEGECFDRLREVCKKYYDFSDEAFLEFKKICFVKEVKKGEILQDSYSTAKYIYFIFKGILITYFLKEDGKVYTKNLFSEDYFSASKVSLLTKENSYLTIEALEDCILIFIDFAGYKELIEKNVEFKDFYINYLEKNWVIAKERNEISLVLDDAKSRYEEFIKNNKNIEKRVALHHIANHLGVTPTQLSRVRKSIKSTYVNDKDLKK